MKRIFTLFIAGSLGLSVSAQRLLTEDFNYSPLPGQLSDNGGATPLVGSIWSWFSGATGFDIMVHPGSLSYPNYFTSPTPTSGKAKLQSGPTTTTSMEDILSPFTTQASASNGTVYCSFLINVTSDATLTTANPEYFMTFLPIGSTNSFYSRVHIRKGTVANTVNFGIAATSVGSTPIQWITTDYPINTTHMITYSYQFVAGPLNDVAKIWVNVPFSATEPAINAANSAASVMTAGTEAVDISRVVMRQAALYTPTCDIDAIKVSTTWADATLPVNLTAFNASLNAGKVNVTWGTAQEVNVKGYAVERSLDANNFSEIGFVNAANASSYSFSDNNVKAGNNYYRLKMVDKDGSVKYSQVVVVNNRTSIKAEIFPNPAVNNLTVNHSKAEAGAVIHIVNLEGKLIKNINVQQGATQTALMVSDLVKGNYMMVFESNGEKAVSKFSKQ